MFGPFKSGSDADFHGITCFRSALKKRLVVLWTIFGQTAEPPTSIFCRKISAIHTKSRFSRLVSIIRNDKKEDKQLISINPQNDLPRNDQQTTQIAIHSHNSFFFLTNKGPELKSPGISCSFFRRQKCIAEITILAARRLC